MKFTNIIMLTVFLLFLGTNSNAQIKPANGNGSKPYTRYWWFASMIQEKDVRYNLTWLKDHGFGGVELAWVYPLNRFNKQDTSYTPRQEWLSSDWSRIVEYTIKYADSIGLGCDLTFGTLWPFGDSYVTFEQATQKFGDSTWRQVITRSWQHPKPGYVIDHLRQENYQPYFNRLIKAFPRPKTKIKQAYFIDSWEVETEKLWCRDFDKDFRKRFGYDVVPFMDSIYAPASKSHLYDYMSLVSGKVLKFYSDFDSTLNAAGILSRGQVSGAPCDLISGYSIMDIPEGESMLFEPEFCAIPASAALLSGKKTVSSETFTCLYGWPRDYMREEQTADLKLVADALFANGINQIIWHGKAHNPEGLDTVNFYATTHIGDKSKMAAEIFPFNQYLQKVSEIMKKGQTYGDIAVYLPTEDAWTKGVMPVEKQFIWAWGYYEMRYVYFPDELSAFNPIWINGEFLEKANVENGFLQVGKTSFKALYVDVEYLDIRVAKRMAELARQGITIILKRKPMQAGAVPNPAFEDYIDQILESKNVYNQIPEKIKSFIEGTNIPRHWCRKDGKALYVFFPNPKSNFIKFPLEYGQSLNKETHQYNIKINYGNKVIPVKLEFAPYQSLLYKIENGKATPIDIGFVPQIPDVKKRPSDFKAPWKVE